MTDRTKVPTLLLPEDWVSGSFPVFMDMRGGGVGWVKHGPAGVNSWALDFTGPQDQWLQGVFRGNLQLAQGAFNEQVMFGIVARQDTFRTGLRAKDGGAYGVLTTSACSYDLHNGRDQLGEDEDDFVEAERTRFGFAANIHALAFVDGQYGIDHLYTGITSGGGAGSFILARDLAEELPDLAENYRGALMDSAPFEEDAYAQVVDEVDNPLTHPDLREVDSDSICTDPPEASVPCDRSNEPGFTAHDEGGLTGQSASEAIDPAQGPEVEVPLLQMYNPRDKIHCQDACFSEQNLHGKIAVAIANRKSDGTPEPFDFSETLEVCIGSCMAGNVVLDCTDHGVIGSVNVAECALDWIDEINEYWESGEQDPYDTPDSCEETIVENLSTNPPACTGPQAEYM